MLLAVDIGNTKIKMALFKGSRILYIWRLFTDKKRPLRHYQKILKRLCGQTKVEKIHLSQIIICSVVPRLTKIFQEALFSIWKIKPLILGKEIVAPIKNLYIKPEQVGQDRLANAVAAFKKYGGPVIVVDFGTAVTFDLVCAKGSYLGGVIVPGMEIALQALIEHADLLPKISLERPGPLLGRDTVASMKSGIVYGYSFLVEGILQHLQKKLKQASIVVATGGAASLMVRYCPSITKVDQNLTLEGLKISYESISIKEKKNKKQ